MSNCSPPFLKLSTNSLGWNYSSIYPKERYRLPSVELASTKDKETNNKGSLLGDVAQEGYEEGKISQGLGDICPAGVMLASLAL